MQVTAQPSETASPPAAHPPPPSEPIGTASMYACVLRIALEPVARLTQPGQPETGHFLGDAKDTGQLRGGP